MDLKTETAAFLKESSRLLEFLYEMGAYPRPKPLAEGHIGGWELKGEDGNVVKLARCLAYAKVGAHHFGGGERTIHVQELPSLAGIISTVRRIRHVKTGKYFSPQSWQSDGEWDYDPGGLEEEKTHKIVEIEREETVGTGWNMERKYIGNNRLPDGWGEWDGTHFMCKPLEIEAYHVTKVVPEGNAWVAVAGKKVVQATRFEAVIPY